MTHLLGRLAGCAAGHWKRSLAIVRRGPRRLGAAGRGRGGAFVDNFTHPRHGVPAGARPPRPSASPPSRATPRRSCSRSSAGRCATGTAAAIAATRRDRAPAARDRRRAAAARARSSAIGFLTVQYDQPAQDLQRAPGERLADASRASASKPGSRSRAAARSSTRPSSSRAPVGELIGLAVAIIVLTLVFRSRRRDAADAGLRSLIALAGGILLLRFGAAFTDFPSFAPTLGVMLGLGAGIDYALLIVGRYREQLARRRHASRTAPAWPTRRRARSVVAAGAIVVVAIAGLLATGIPFVGRMGVGSAIVVASRRRRRRHGPAHADGRVRPPAAPEHPETVAPAARLRALGDPHHQAPRGPPRSPARSSCSRWPPRCSACASACPTTATTRAGTTTRVAYDRLAEGFGVGFNGPLSLATDNMGALRQTRGRRRRRRRGVAFVSEPVARARQATRATLTVIPTTSPQDPRTSDLVTHLRDNLPNGVYVGGAVAMLDDMAAKIAEPAADLHRARDRPQHRAADGGLPQHLGPARVARPSTCSRSAPPTAWSSPSSRPAWTSRSCRFVPLFMFAILFGLSMDYNVFLQSRIREEYLNGRDAGGSP